MKTEPECDPDALLRQAVRANVRRSTNALRNGSEILRQLMDRDGLRIVGAEYSLESGEVDFFDGVPGPLTTMQQCSVPSGTASIKARGVKFGGSK